MNRFFSRNGRQTVRCILSPIEAAGGISTAGETIRVEPLYPMEAEFGQPQWVFGTSLYAFSSATRIVCTYAKDGRDYLATLDTENRTLETIELPFTTISQVRASGNRVVFIGSAGNGIRFDRISRFAYELLRYIAAVERSNQPCRLPHDTASDRISHRARIDRPRIFLPADQSRLRRAGE